MAFAESRSHCTMTASFRSAGRTFDYQTHTTGPLDLSGTLARHVPAQPATWAALLSRTVDEPRPRAQASVLKCRERDSAHTLRPELQDVPRTIHVREHTEPKVPPPREVRGITSCERKHNPRVYQDTVELGCSENRPPDHGYSAVHIADMRRKERFAEEESPVIGGRESLRIKDSAQSAVAMAKKYFVDPLLGF